MAEIREQKGHIPEASEIQSRGHGGKRIKGLVGVSADEHDFIESQIVLYFDQWFETEKKEHASHSPNPDPNEKGIYQIDNIFENHYYDICVGDLRDLWHLSDSTIRSYTLWRKVWAERHPDLVMRV